MQKLIYFALVLTLLLGSATLTLASSDDISEVSSPRPRIELREQVKEEAREVKEQRQEDRQEVRQQVQSQVQVMRSDAARLHANRLNNRFQFYYQRLMGIVARIQARIDEGVNSGKDESTAQATLDSAKAKLAEAKQLGDQSVSSFEAIDPAKFSEQRDDALAARDVANQSREAFKLALSLLKQANKEVL